AIAAGNQLFDGLRSADKLDPCAASSESAASSTAATTSAAARRLLALLPRPVSIVREVLEYAILDVDQSTHRRAVGRKRRGEQIGSRRIGKDRHTLVGALLTELRSAAGFTERASTFVIRPRVERADDLRDQLTNRGRFEDDRVQPRLDSFGRVTRN